MIRVIVGNVGAGKTLGIIKEMYNNPNWQYISNIKTNSKIKNNQLIKPENIIKKVPIKTKKNGEIVYNYEFNKDFWIDLKKKKPNIHIVIDEIHTIFNSRRSSSKINIIFSDFLALIRKIMSGKDARHGTCTLITQLTRRVDVIGLDMATHIQYCVCQYTKKCRRCNYEYIENNETPEYTLYCPKCNSNNIYEKNHIVIVHHFNNIANFIRWRETGDKTYYKRNAIIDGETYFPMYDTLQWDNLLTFQ